MKPPQNRYREYRLNTGTVLQNACLYASFPLRPDTGTTAIFSQTMYQLPARIYMSIFRQMRFSETASSHRLFLPDFPSRNHAQEDAETNIRAEARRQMMTVVF